VSRNTANSLGRATGFNLQPGIFLALAAFCFASLFTQRLLFTRQLQLPAL